MLFVFVSLFVLSSGTRCSGPLCFQVSPQHLPEPVDVYESLFARVGQLKLSDKLNLSYTVATAFNFVLESILATDPNDISKMVRPPDDYEPALGSDIGIRAFTSCYFYATQKGDVKTYKESNITPPMINMSYSGSVQLTPDDVIFRLPRQTAHWGHRVWYTIFADYHASLYSRIQKRFPTSSAYWKFMSVGAFSIHITNLSLDLFKRFFQQDSYEQLKAETVINSCSEEDRNLTFPMDLEYKDIYQWHSILPDVIEYDDPIPLSYTLRNASGYTSYSLNEHIQAFSRTRIGSFTPNNEPNFTRFITPETIRRARALNLGTMNDLREKYNLTRHRSFEEFGAVGRKLRSLYRSVDDIDSHVALILDPQPGRLVSDLVLSSILHGAIHRLRYFYRKNCIQMRLLEDSAILSDIMHAPIDPVYAMGIGSVDGRHPFDIISNHSSVPSTPKEDTITTIRFGVNADNIIVKRFEQPNSKIWKKTNNVFKTGNVALTYNMTSKVISAARFDGSANRDREIKFKEHGIVVDGDEFNASAIPLDWIPGGCNPSLGGVRYYRADRDYYVIYDVFSAATPTLSGVMWMYQKPLRSLSALDKINYNYRELLEGIHCMDQPKSMNPKQFVQSQHVLFNNYTNARCLNDKCGDSLSCFSCGLYSSRMVSSKFL